jgi:hypothetical protein
MSFFSSVPIRTKVHYAHIHDSLSIFARTGSAALPIRAMALPFCAMAVPVRIGTAISHNGRKKRSLHTVYLKTVIKRDSKPVKKEERSCKIPSPIEKHF